MAFDRQFLDELIARNDIVDVVSNYVSLQPRGGSLWGCCPFHSEKTPSFHVLPDKQLCYCFGCKKGGGVINFIMEEENLSFPDAVRFLARRANMPVPEEEHSDESRLRSRILSLNRDAARFYYDQLYSPKGVPVLEYMKNRKITRRNATNFGLGASADEWDGLLTAMRKKGYGDGELLASGLAIRGKNGGLYDKFRKRLIFPIIDVRGDVLGFGGRIISKDDPGAKYMNTPETIVYSKRRVLYGLNLAKKSKRSNIILVEGNIDVVMLHQAGFDNACASMGTALTTEQLQLLSRYTKEIVLCYDNDDAGKVATQKALTLLNNTDFQVKVLELPKRLVDGEYIKQDADDFIKFQGKDAFEHLLSGSESGMDFRMAHLKSKFDLKSDEGRIGFAEAAAGLLSTVPNAVEREIYTVRASEAAGITPDAMKLEVERARKRARYKEKREQERRDLTPAVQLQPRSYPAARAVDPLHRPSLGARRRRRAAAFDAGRFPLWRESADPGRGLLLPPARPVLHGAARAAARERAGEHPSAGGIFHVGGDQPLDRYPAKAGVAQKRRTGAQRLLQYHFRRSAQARSRQ